MTKPFECAICKKKDETVKIYSLYETLPGGHLGVLLRFCAHEECVLKAVGHDT